MAERANPELQELRKIERQVTEIKKRTGNPFVALMSGIFYGAGWIIGGIGAVLLVSWVLSIIGVIPGLDKIAEAIGQAFRYWHGGR